MKDNADSKNAVDVLSTMSILKEFFSITEIELFVKIMNFQRYKENVKIISQGGAATSLMCLLTGEVRVISKDHQVGILRAGEIFG